MDIAEKLALISKNTVEVVTQEDLKKLLETNKKPVAYCGYEPSGEVHLGHLVTITKLTELEKAGVKVKILLADWHAFLNRKGDWDFIKTTAKDWETVFRQLGLKNAEYVLGSKFQRTPEYIDDVLTLSSHITINRGMRSMQEVARDIENAHISQAIYPLMQIVDIKHLKVDIAQAGIEQRKIHMLGREVFELINYKKPVYVHTPLVNALQGEGKMSSSIKDTLISVRDSEDAIRKKISKAYCPEGIVEKNPVLEICQLVIFPRVKEFNVERPAKFGGNASFSSFDELKNAFAAKQLHPMDLKNAAAKHLSEILINVRKIDA